MMSTDIHTFQKEKTIAIGFRFETSSYCHIRILTSDIVYYVTNKMMYLLLC
jgi:hypothetical protein